MIRFALTVAVLCVLLMLGLVLQRLVAGAKLKSVLASFEADGLPLSWPTYYSRFPDLGRHLAAQSNLFAALDQLSAAPVVSDERRKVLPVEGSAELPQPDAPLSPAMTDAIETRLREVSPSLDAVRKAVAEEPFWLVAPTNSNDPRLFHHLGEIRQGARLLKMTAILQAERGNVQEGLAAVRDGLRLAEVPHRGSVLIDELVRFACEGVAISSLESVLAKTDPSPARLQEIDYFLLSYDDSRTGLMGEAVYVKQWYEPLSKMTYRDMKAMTDLCAGAWRQHVLAYLLVQSSGWLQMNEAYSLELLHEAIRHWNLPWVEFHAWDRSACTHVPRMYFIAGFSKYDYSAVKNRELRVRGSWACARLAIAIKKYSMAEGRLPDDLASLKPKYMAEIPAEPFHGRPFKYVKTGDAGVISFPCPDSDYVVKFRVYAAKRKALNPEH